MFGLNFSDVQWYDWARAPFSVAGLLLAAWMLWVGIAAIRIEQSNGRYPSVLLGLWRRIALAITSIVINIAVTVNTYVSMTSPPPSNPWRVGLYAFSSMALFVYLVYDVWVSNRLVAINQEYAEREEVAHAEREGK